MACRDGCGCPQEARDARTDEWVQIAPESARAATLTPEQPVKAPVEGQDSQRPSEPVFIDPSTLAPGTVVEVERPNGSRLLRYVDEGGYQFLAGEVGSGSSPYSWRDARIVRVFAEAKPTQEPRRIEPEDVRVGMVVERRNGESYVGGRVESVGDPYIKTDVGAIVPASGGLLADIATAVVLYALADAATPGPWISAEPIGQEVDLPLHRTEAGSALDTMGADQ